MLLWTDILQKTVVGYLWKNSQNLLLLPTARNLVPAPGAFWVSTNDLFKQTKFEVVEWSISSRVLRRMKACVDEFRPKLFWSILEDSKTNAQIEVGKQEESFCAIHRGAISYVCNTHYSSAVNSKWIRFFPPKPCFLMTSTSKLMLLLVFKSIFGQQTKK